MKKNKGNKKATSNKNQIIQSKEDSLISDINKISKELIKNDDNIGVFKVKTANQWMDEASLRPIPKMLFSEFWFESELCILFADTNLGKSILAVQIGNSISKGEPILGFKLEAKKQRVLYFDFELSDKQFENRYSQDFQSHFSFDDDFIRIEINPEKSVPKGESFEEFLYGSIEKTIIEKNAQVLIIDNLTYLKNETEKAKDALPLMKHLKHLKSKYNLSILALAHTPKRELSKPISRNDLQGSKMLMNFCDSSFAIGESHSDKNIKYLKQIKVRNSEFIFDIENVCVCQICKPENFLKFDFLSHSHENEHLRILTDEGREKNIEKVKELSAKNFTQREISEKLGISLGTVNKYLNL